MSASWRLTVWMGVISLVSEGMGAVVMYEMSNLYLTITTNNRHSFWLHITLALSFITCQAILQSYKTYLGEKCSVFWRKNLVDHLHGELSTVYCQHVTNTDQRCTQDADLLSSELATLIEKTLVLPCVILFYSSYVLLHFGLLAWLACVVYFIVGASLGNLLAHKIVMLVYNQGQYEGDFRLFHSHYMSHRRLISLLLGGLPEQLVLKQSFNLLIWNKQSIILHTLYLNLCTNWFAYAGAVVTYFIVGLSILYPNMMISLLPFAFSTPTTTTASISTAEDRMILMSRGSYACMNLIYAFTNALSIYSLFVSYRGHLHRVEDLLPNIDLLHLMLFNKPRDLRPRTSSSSSSSSSGWISYDSICRLWSRLGLYAYPYRSLSSGSRGSGRGSVSSSSSSLHRRSEDGEDSLEEGLLLSSMPSGGYHSQQPHANGYNAATIVTRSLTLEGNDGQSVIQLQHFRLKIVDEDSLEPRFLITGLDLDLQYNMRLLITGRSGVGKSQLLQYIASLFRPKQSSGGIGSSSSDVHERSIDNAEGQTISTTPRSHLIVDFDDIFIDDHLSMDQISLLPQSPYHLLQETVWEFLHYPHTIDTFHEVSSEHKHALYQALDQCNIIEKFVQPHRSGENRSVIDGIISRLQSLSMQNMSLGEKQILSVARYLLRVFQRPLGNKTVDVLLLDEITSAVDEEGEQVLYQAITKLCSTFISVGHRSTIRNFHTHQLHVYPDGSCSFSKIQTSP